jgi:hypothetical protein
MTTKITVDAHAGFPVKVTKIFFGGTDKETLEETTVAPYTKVDYHIFDDCSIILKELPPTHLIVDTLQNL